MNKVKNNDTVPRSWVGQEIQPGDYYTIQATESEKWANNSAVLSDVGSQILIVNNGTVDVLDVAQAINLLKDLAPKEVVTQIEKPDKDLVLASAENGFTGTSCVLQIKIPGTLGDMDSRYVAGGYAFTDVYGWGDRVTKVQLLDKDFVYAGLAYPATPIEAGIPGTEGLAWVDIMPDGVEMGSFTDDACDEINRGWRLWCDDGNQGGMDIDPLGGFGRLPALAYIMIIVEKTQASQATKASINVWWGKKNA